MTTRSGEAPTRRILIPLEEWRWMPEAARAASILARDTGAEIILLRMVPVQHIAWLGTELGDLHSAAYWYLPALQAALTKSGIPYQVRQFQFTSFVDGVAQAVELFDASVIFARTPNCPIPFWRQFQNWRLRRLLEQSHCRWYELTDGGFLATMPGEAALDDPVAPKALEQRLFQAAGR